MFYKMIENKCREWYHSEECTVHSLYLEDTLTETERIQITHKKICDFFKEKIL